MRYYCTCGEAGEQLVLHPALGNTPRAAPALHAATRNMAEKKSVIEQAFEQIDSVRALSCCASGFHLRPLPPAEQALHESSVNLRPARAGSGRVLAANAQEN